MKRLFIFTGIFVISCTLCFAWDKGGHAVVAKIAEMNVKPETLAKINKILDGKTMVDVSSWADGDVRTTRAETDHWHSVAVPVDRAVTAKDIAGFYPATQNNVIYQLKKEIEELKGNNITPQERKEDLMFLIHFVGDLHMPMHCAKFRGINVAVPDGKKPTMLHAVWDAMLPVKDVDKYSLDLNKNITLEEKKAWAIDDPDLWVYESYSIAKEKIFKSIPEKVTTIELPKNYKTENAPIAKERIKKAGIRLAMLLDKIFK